MSLPGHKYDEMVSRMRKVIHTMYAIDKYEWDDMFVVFENRMTPRQSVRLVGSFESILNEYLPQTNAFNASNAICDILSIVASGFLSLHKLIDITPLMLSYVLEKSFEHYMNHKFCETVDITESDDEDEMNAASHCEPDANP